MRRNFVWMNPQQTSPEGSVMTEEWRLDEPIGLMSVGLEGINFFELPIPECYLLGIWRVLGGTSHLVSGSHLWLVSPLTMSLFCTSWRREMFQMIWCKICKNPWIPSGKFMKIPDIRGHRIIPKWPLEDIPGRTGQMSRVALEYFTTSKWGEP